MMGFLIFWFAEELHNFYSSGKSPVSSSFQSLKYKNTPRYGVYTPYEVAGKPASAKPVGMLRTGTQPA